ncbi:cullin-4A [Trichonephila clavipes]|nr:cullin-4A [Trichonephila clavipes]
MEKTERKNLFHMHCHNSSCWWSAYYGLEDVFLALHESFNPCRRTSECPRIFKCYRRSSTSCYVMVYPAGGLGLNPGEGIDVCKCIVPSRHEGTLNRRRAASPLVRLITGDKRWETLTVPQGVLPHNLGGIELNRTVTCMARKVTVSNERTSGLLP